MVSIFEIINWGITMNKILLLGGVLAAGAFSFDGLVRSGNNIVWYTQGLPIAGNPNQTLVTGLPPVTMATYNGNLSFSSSSLSSTLPRSYIGRMRLIADFGNSTITGATGDYSAAQLSTPTFDGSTASQWSPNYRGLYVVSQ